MGVFGGTPANGYLREGGCVFGQPLSPTSQLLNEALEPMDDEETIRMDEEPSNNVALNILPQELIWSNNSAQVCNYDVFNTSSVVVAIVIQHVSVITHTLCMTLCTVYSC